MYVCMFCVKSFSINVDLTVIEWERPAIRESRQYDRCVCCMQHPNENRNQSAFIWETGNYLPNIFQSILLHRYCMEFIVNSFVLVVAVVVVFWYSIKTKSKSQIKIKIKINAKFTEKRDTFNSELVQ